MNAPTAAQVDRWRERLAAHTLRDGVCPVCEVPHRCRPWADAFAELLTHGYLPEPTPTPTTGGTPPAGSTGGEPA